MSEWTSLQDIMQDLSVAQGCIVPASLEICTNRGPPQLSISEEDSDEQAHYQCDGSGDFTPFTNPDFGLIKQMLNKVNEKKDNSDDHDPILNSALNPFTTDFVPQKIQKKINRNVALSSILETKNSELAARRPAPINVIPVMFKRKSSETTKVKSESVSPLQVSSPEKYNQYTPTEQANEYYSKYLEKSKLREQFQEDIWSIAERKMKEIDAKKKLAAEINDSPGSPGGFDIVNLPQHRHRLTGPCIVCSVASKHGYDFTEEPTS